jgi:hypothetical protein
MLRFVPLADLSVGVNTHPLEMSMVEALVRSLNYLAGIGYGCWLTDLQYHETIQCSSE